MMIKQILEIFNRKFFGETIENLISKRAELDQMIIDLRAQLKQKSEIESPKPTGKLSYNETRSILNQLGVMNVYLADTQYSTCPKNNALLFQQKIGVNLKRYIAEDHDCDVFSFESMGYWNKDDYQYAYFIVWSNTHAFNLFIDDEKNIWIIEPQSAKFYSIDEARKIPNYFPVRTLIG